MTPGRGWYVKAVKRAFPHAEALVSGPFDEHGPARAERRRIVPLYPDADLTTVLEVAASLPERTPRRTPPGAPAERAMFDLRNVGGRRQAAAWLAERAEALGATVWVEDWSGDPDVDVSVPALRANIWLAWLPAAPMPIISWVARDGRKLKANLPGAWRGEGFAHYKATTIADTWAQLFEALEIGLLAGIDGSAFEMEI